MKKSRCILVGATFFTILMAGVCFARNTVVALDPLRLEFTEGKNSSHVKIINSSNESLSYKISTYALRMQKDGVLVRPEKLTKREALAKGMVNFSPRITTVPAGKTQIVRVAVRRPPGLPSGDYFTYLNVSPIKTKTSEDAPKKSNESIAINMNIGLSIPVIVTVGEYAPHVTLQSVQKAYDRRGRKIFRMTLKRAGQFNSYNAISVYGRINGKEKLIAHNKRIVTYVPVKEREVQVPLIEESFSGNAIRVELKRLEDNEEVLIKSYDIKI